MTIEIRQVLCPVDFSDFSRRALDHAVAMSQWYGSRLTVMYVHHVPVPGQAVALPFAPVSLGPLELSPLERQQLQQGLQALVPAEAVKTLRVQYLVAESDVAGEILTQAASADMLVMGTHGRSGFEHLVLGSVAEKVLRKAACPVLVVPRNDSNATAKVPALSTRLSRPSTSPTPRPARWRLRFRWPRKPTPI
jgi:nucleotide-binding universal stress UspA family protein